MFSFEIDHIIRNALNEDIGYGDVTTESCVPETARISGYFLAKENGVVCGLNIVGRVFQLLDEAVVLKYRVQEGQKVSKGDVIADIEGPARSVLTGERTALNLLQRMSGIAT
ncbi:MAG: nicotinate-nucleotide diphosphorylase (carboxylating), partial [Clostridiales bacterium]|nr:nicotinate-nucleotide diphosphorylase (carboxylating) [Clostridiales bacterium]